MNIKLYEFLCGIWIDDAMIRPHNLVGGCKHLGKCPAPIYYPEEAGRMFFQNVCNHMQNCTAL
jgi:hypothetical protein